MNEVKTPKKPLLFYYLVALVAVMLFNFLAMPWISEHQIRDVDYNTFVDMTEQGKVGKVEIQQEDNRILFTDTDGKTIYKTAMVPDDDLVSRLLKAGVSTTGSEIQQSSFLMDLLGWIVPLVIFIGIGQVLSRKMMQKMGGGNSMMFNMGKSNAKVYVKSAEGIKFSDVAGRGKGESGGDCGLPSRSYEVPGNRRVHAQGNFAGRPSGNRQNHAGQGGGRRGQRTVFLHVRFRVRGDVCGHGRLQGAGPL